MQARAAIRRRCWSPWCVLWWPVPHGPRAERWRCSSRAELRAVQLVREVSVDQCWRSCRSPVLRSNWVESIPSSLRRVLTVVLLCVCVHPRRHPSRHRGALRVSMSGADPSTCVGSCVIPAICRLQQSVLCRDGTGLPSLVSSSSSSSLSASSSSSSSSASSSTCVGLVGLLLLLVHRNLGGRSTSDLGGTQIATLGDCIRAW